MKFYTIACQVLSRECFFEAANSPHIVTVSIQSSDLHDKPDDLRSTLQSEIDKASEGDYDYILLAYGLCSRGTAELTARSIPIVIPRAHDCITLFLGSKERYADEFMEHPGTYYYSSGWIEFKNGELHEGTFQSKQKRHAEERFKEYVEKYGEDNAKYLLEQESLWLANYNRAAFIDTGLGNVEYYRKFTKDMADSHGWLYEEVSGDSRLLKILLSGHWNDQEFLVVKPGQQTFEDVNSGIINAR